MIISRYTCMLYVLFLWWCDLIFGPKWYSFWLFEFEWIWRLLWKQDRHPCKAGEDQSCGRRRGRWSCTHFWSLRIDSRGRVPLANEIPIPIIRFLANDFTTYWWNSVEGRLGYITLCFHQLVILQLAASGEWCQAPRLPYFTGSLSGVHRKNEWLWLLQMLNDEYAWYPSWYCATCGSSGPLP